MWERGKGSVLTGVFGIPYYRDTNPVLVADKITAIEAVLTASTQRAWRHASNA